MILIIVGAILCPILLSGDGKFYALIGSVLGLIISVMIGLFLPTSVFVTNSLPVVSVEKIWVEDCWGTQNSSIRLSFIRDNNQCDQSTYYSDKANIFVNNEIGQKIKIFEGHTVFVHNLSWLFAVAIPVQRLLVEAPASMIQSISTPLSTPLEQPSELVYIDKTYQQ